MNIMEFNEKSFEVETLSLYLISDIHLEYLKNPTNLIKLFKRDEKDNGVLLIAGDLGNPYHDYYREFLVEMSKCYLKVFFVTGNHEYYQKNNKIHDLYDYFELEKRPTIDDVNEHINNLIKGLDNVHFLNNNSVIYRGIKFIGCTLWTESDKEAIYFMNDYKYINNFTPKICQRLHRKDISWLESELSVTNPQKVVVLTHHLPTYKLIADKYKSILYCSYNKYFATDLEDLVKKADIWCCGHSHNVNSVTIGKCQCYLNPFGYAHESTGFGIEFKIILPTCKEN